MARMPLPSSCLIVSAVVIIVNECANDASAHNLRISLRLKSSPGYVTPHPSTPQRHASFQAKE